MDNELVTPGLMETGEMGSRMARIEERMEEENGQAGIAGDRRFDKRYQLQLDLRWKLIRRRKIQDSGAGRTVDLSSGGILFDATRTLPVGLNVELSIAWPVLLHNVAPMQLVVSGKIVRSAGNHTAIHISAHEFRTVGVPSDHRQMVANTARGPVLISSSAGSNGFNKMQ